VTWESAEDGYLTWLAASGATPGTLRLRRHYLSRVRALADSPDVIDPATLATFLSCPSWAPETRKAARSACLSFFTWACHYGVIASNPAVDLPAVRVPKPDPRPAPDSVIATAMKGADERTKDMLMLAAFAGLRCREIARLHSEEITEKSLRPLGKGGKRRTIPLLPILADRLRGREGFVFPGNDDGHLSPSRVGRLISNALPKGWTAHTLRHRFASQAYAVERDLRAVQELLGHASVATTQIYTAIPPEAKWRAVLGAGVLDEDGRPAA
jgi:integrase/recombinase XerC